MGFYPQPNDWTCGPFAIKHALAALGRTVDEDDVAANAKTHWWSGTDELRLARAVSRYGCDLEQRRSLDPERARRSLTAHLRKRMPALLCVDDWEHWVTVLHESRGRFVLVDSLLDPVLGVVSWRELQKRWVYHDIDYDEDDPPQVYDYFAVLPRFRVTVRGDFSIARVKHLRRPENQLLAECWDQYLGDLLEICRPRSAQMNDPLTVGEFLRRNNDLLINRVTYWHGEVPIKAVARVLANLRFVAETYGLVIPTAAKRRAMADFVVLLTLWSASVYGVDGMYGEGGD